jgi:hypothetical protein
MSRIVLSEACGRPAIHSRDVRLPVRIGLLVFTMFLDLGRSVELGLGTVDPVPRDDFASSKPARRCRSPIRHIAQHSESDAKKHPADGRYSKDDSGSRCAGGQGTGHLGEQARLERRQGLLLHGLHIALHPEKIVIGPCGGFRGGLQFAELGLHFLIRL